MLTLLGQTYLEFLYAPIIFPEILWILIPTLWAILLMELYFDRYRREGIGHHKSLENTIFLLFISANLLYISLQHPVIVPKLVVSIAFIVFSIMIGLMDFFHKLPTELIFKGSAKFIVAFVSYISIILVYSNLLEDLTALSILAIVLSIGFMFLTFVLVIKIVAFFEPKSYEEIEHFLKNIEEDIKRSHEESVKQTKGEPVKQQKGQNTGNKETPQETTEAPEQSTDK